MERYTHGHHGSVVANHAQRRAADSAAFLLPRLESSMRLLDLGCGPGSVTLDLARFVAEVVGVDAAVEAIAAARGAAEASGVRSRFEVADVYELPFEDSSFDVVFAHQVLQHLGDPVRALVEARRVLRPGGLMAAREADYGTMVHHPHTPALGEWLTLYKTVARHNGGEPDAGRRVAGWFADAGFEQLEVSSSTWTYHTRSEVEGWRDLWVSRLTEARLGEHAVALGLADRDRLATLADGWRQWASSRQAFFAFLHGEVVAVR
ncbi:MAG: methyltransferase domain-containing protein [Acidimicrobiia bacterium]|nr:methyltransferase domain-containing protein [Acidimicrobiia bacterium]